ncbi:hypothetical protein CIL05_09460 [Virgibacillus profundi]|uniref:Integrase catalytic domain-containing protein n=1 Tax=Virgibacillus profundi TaxID=2024555 RepID=A0A2A2IE33_9BACI|nr:hypothetical protein CIL05_09460 [Virgibacillus profundi]PXY54003.1 hypothetical protein CIT14_09550 [Virgibacillus profundi]
MIKEVQLRTINVTTGKLWDHASLESFFGHFKGEAYIKLRETLEELKKEVKQYMIYYNNYRYQ